MKTTGDRRREKLEELARRSGGLRRVAERSGLSHAALDQVLKMTLLEPKKDGTRNRKQLGDAAARTIEEAFGLGVGWFDSDLDAAHSPDGLGVETRMSQNVTTAQNDVEHTFAHTEIPTTMPYSAPNLKSAILLMGNLLGALDSRSKSIIGDMLKDLAAHTDDAEDIANKASALATVQKQIANDPALDKAIKGRRSVETSHGPLR